MTSIIKATRRILAGLSHGGAMTPDVIFNVALNTAAMRGDGDRSKDGAELLDYLFSDDVDVASEIDEVAVYAVCGVAAMCGPALLTKLEKGMQEYLSAGCTATSPLRSDLKLRSALITGFGCIYSIVRSGTFQECPSGDFGAHIIIPTALESIDLSLSAAAATTRVFSLDTATAVLEQVLTAQTGLVNDQRNADLNTKVLAAAMSCVQHAQQWLPQFSSTQYYSDAGATNAAPTSMDVASIIKILSRRVLVPLLSQNLGADVPDSARVMAEGLVEQLSSSGQTAEVVMVAASLFDLLFINRGNASDAPAVAAASTNPEVFKRTDFRFNSVLWDVLLAVLKDAMVSEDISSVQRSTLELQASYLLKRIVSVCEDESGVAHADKRGDPTSAHKNNKGAVNNNNKKGKYADPNSQAPLVATATPGSSVISETQMFSPVFNWCPKGSSAVWNSFFLVLETLTEYGVHIVTPALDKITTELVPAIQQGLIHPAWVELLFIKGLRHGNTGVRKVTLKALWATEMSVLLSFSPEMICQGALETAVDGRLATEVDKIVLPTNFLEVVSRSFEDIPISTVTPIVNGIITFYTAYITAVANQQVSQAAADLPPPEELITLMLLTISETSPRFSIATIIRVVMEVVRDAPVTLNGNVIYALLKVYKESIVDKHPQWMQARLVAMCVDTALAVATQTTECNNDEYYAAFERLIGVCGKGGDEGRLDLQLDAPGISQGSVLGVRPVVGRFVATSSSPTSSIIIKRYLDSTVPCMHELLQTKEEVPISTIKSFATKAAILIAHEESSDSAVPEADRAIWLVLGALTGAAASVVDRAYCDVFQQVNALRLFTEVVCAVGIPQVATVVSADVVKAIYQGANNLLNSWVSPLHAAMPPACSSEVFDSVCDVVTTSIAILAGSDSLEVAVYEANMMEWVAVVDRIYTTSSGTTTTPPPYSGVIARNATRVLHALCVPYAVLKETRSPTTNITAALLRVLPTALPVLLRNPSPLTGTAAEAELAGFDNIGTIQSMISRYTLTVLLCLTTAVSDGSHEDRHRVVPQLCSGVLGEWSSDVVEISAANNLPQLFALIAAVSKLVVSTMSPIPGAVEDAFVLVWSRQKAPERRAAIRCSAIAYQMLSILSNIDCDRAIQFVRDVVSNEAETDRAAFFASLVSCSTTLNHIKASSTVETHLIDLIVHQCCIVNRGFVGENEMENCVAVVEIPFLSWSEVVRKAFPASPAVVSVARALSLSTLLYICKTSTNEVAPTVFMKLIALLKSHPDVTREPCMPNSKAHRCRLRILQLISLMMPLITPESPAFKALTAFLFDTALLQNNMGSIRKHYEILAIKVLVLCPANIVPHLSRHLSNFELKAQAGASFAKVAINVMLHLQQGEVRHDLHSAPSQPTPMSSKDIYNFLKRLGNSYQHLMRIVAHIGSHCYLTSEKAMRGVDSLDDDQVRYLHYLNTAGEVLKFRDKHYGVVIFDWDMELLPSSLLCVQRMEGQYWLQDSIGWETFWRCGELVNEVSSILRMGYPLEGLVASGVVSSLFGGDGEEDTTINTMMTALLHDGLIPAMTPSSTEEASDCDTGLLHLSKSTLCFGDALQQLSLAHDRLSGKQGGANHARAGGEDVGDDDGSVDAAVEANTNMQRKVQSWWTSEVYNELHPRSLGRAQRQPLVIVGSLLENPVNIAGLCRCADIFAVEGVVVPNKRVFEHPHFIAAARSAEKWIQWEEVPESGLIVYLRRMKLKGYTAVGIEQTADSESMATYQFPERAVVVLGSEGKGIPPGILPFLDVCVEIPQFGLIRSLNVHVTGALAMYEYTKQHLMTTSPQ